MKKIIYLCDLCGKETQADDSTPNAKVGTTKGETAPQVFLDEVLFCEDCANVKTPADLIKQIAVYGQEKHGAATITEVGFTRIDPTSQTIKGAKLAT